MQTVSSVVSIDGTTATVTRPEIGEEDQEVILVATFSSGSEEAAKTDTKEFTFTIKAKAKEQNSINFTKKTYTKVYDGKQIESETDFSASASNGEVTYSYYVWQDSDGEIQDNTDFSAKEYSNTVPQNAGTYIIKASVAESGEYSATEAYAVIVITKKAYEEDFSKTLKATTNGLKVTLDVEEASELTLEYAYAMTDSAPEDGWKDSNTFTMPGVGSYYFFARVKESENVTASAPIKTDAVKVLNPTVITFSGENTIKNNIVYDGSPIQAGETLTGDVDFVGATVADTSDDRKPSYFYHKLGDGETKDTPNLEFTTGLPTDAGEYVIKATFAENDSYEKAEKTIELAIEKAQVNAYVQISAGSARANILFWKERTTLYSTDDKNTVIYDNGEKWMNVEEVTALGIEFSGITVKDDSTNPLHFVSNEKKW